MDKPDTACLQIRKAAERINDIALRIAIKRVHREITTHRIVGNILGKPNDRMAPVGFNISAERRDLKRGAIHHQCYCPMIDTCRNRLDACAFRQSDCLIRRRIGRDIDVVNRYAQQAVAHTAAHRKGLMTGRIEHRKNALGGGVCQPIGGDGVHGLIRSASERKIRAVAPQM